MTNATTATQIDAELEAGTVLELTYDGQQGPRTIPVEIVARDDRIPWDDDLHTVEWTARDLDRGDRYLAFKTEPDNTITRYTSVRSLAARQAKNGQRLGNIMDAEVVGEADESHRSRIDTLRNADEGERLRVEFEDADRDAVEGAVVIGRRQEATKASVVIETDEGDRHSIFAGSHGVRIRSDEVRVENLGTDDRALEDEEYSAARSWFIALDHGDHVEFRGEEFIALRRIGTDIDATLDLVPVEDVEDEDDLPHHGGYKFTFDALGFRLSEGVGDDKETARLPTVGVLEDNHVEHGLDLAADGGDDHEVATDGGEAESETAFGVREDDTVTVEFGYYRETLTGAVTRATDSCFEFVPEDGSDEDWDRYCPTDADRIRVYEDTKTVHVHHPDWGTGDLAHVGHNAAVEIDARGEPEGADHGPFYATNGLDTIPPEDAQRRVYVSNNQPRVSVWDPDTVAEATEPFEPFDAGAHDVFAVEVYGRRWTAATLRIGSDGYGQLDPAGEADEISFHVDELEGIEWYASADVLEDADPGG